MMPDEHAPLTAAEVEAIRARADAAPAGPWRVEYYFEVALVRGQAETVGELLMAFTRSAGDFIAAARTDVPRLLATLDAYREVARAVVAAALPCTLAEGDCHLTGDCEPEWAGPITPDGYWRHATHCPVTRARALLGEEAQ